MAKSSLPANLKRRAIGLAGQLTKLARSKAPNHLKQYIRSFVEQIGDARFVIRTVVENKNPLPKWGSADARAQEYGSGERAEFGSKGRYPIVPKNKKFLVFEWDVANDNIPRLPDGRVMLSKVMHPGIPPRPYIRPAVREIRRKLKEEVDEAVRNAVSVDFRGAFAGAKKHQ